MNPPKLPTTPPIILPRVAEVEGEDVKVEKGVKAEEGVKVEEEGVELEVGVEVGEEDVELESSVVLEYTA